MLVFARGVKRRPAAGGLASTKLAVGCQMNAA